MTSLDCVHVSTLNSEWDSALRSQDVRFLQDTLHQQFSLVTPSGKRLSKDQYLRIIQSGATIVNPESGTTTITVNGDTAVVTGRTAVVHRGASDARPEVYTNVYARLDGHWVAMASHSSFAT